MVRVVIDSPRPSDPDPGFRADLRATLTAWRAAPMLVVVGVAITLVGLLSGDAFLPSLVWAAVVIPWSGVQRVWYLRVFRGQPISDSEFVRLLLDFFGRFLRLGLLLLPAGVPVMIVFLVVPADSRRVAGPAAIVVMGILVNVALTFVTPALAYSTRRVRRATRIGLGMIRTTWPACGPYVLLPPIATSALSVPYVMDSVVRPVGTIVSTLALSLFIGANARFYLRRFPTGEFGAIPTGPEDGERAVDPTPEANEGVGQDSD